MAAKMTHRKTAKPRVTTLAALNRPADTRERVRTDVRLWDPDTERLAYGAGTMVPADEVNRLVPDAEWLARRAR